MTESVTICGPCGKALPHPTAQHDCHPLGRYESGGPTLPPPPWLEHVGHINGRITWVEERMDRLEASITDLAAAILALAQDTPGPTGEGA